MIYLERELQQQVLVDLQLCFEGDGYLLLGSSETADYPAGLFRSVDRDARIYQSHKRARIEGFFACVHPASRGSHAGLQFSLGSRDCTPAATHQHALELTGPPSMLVDINHLIVNMSEEAGRFLQPSGGQLRNDVTELVRPELRFDLRAALHRAFERNQPILSLGIPVKFNGSPQRVFMQVKPVTLSVAPSRPWSSL